MDIAVVDIGAAAALAFAFLAVRDVVVIDWVGPVHAATLPLTGGTEGHRR